jgi:hypothetical protein
MALNGHFGGLRACLEPYQEATDATREAGTRAPFSLPYPHKSNRLLSDLAAVKGWVLAMLGFACAWLRSRLRRL